MSALINYRYSLIRWVLNYWKSMWRYETKNVKLDNNVEVLK